MTWTQKDIDAAKADGWELANEKIRALDRGRFPTRKDLLHHLWNLRRKERYHTSESGGLTFQGNDGLATRALREMDQALVRLGRKQFLDVNSTNGAPMGRHDVGDPGDKPMRLFKVQFVDGAYDDGGAYWGSGEPLYCLRGEGPDEQVQRFVRAKSRIHAFLKLRLQFPELRLANPINPAHLKQFEVEIERGERDEDGTSRRVYG
jgi:hypothetical protein